MLRVALALFAGFTLIPFCIAADEPADEPAGAPAAPGAGELRVTVTGVEGTVQVRESDSRPWKKCEVGMVLGQGAEFRTGLRSAVRCEIPPDQTFTIDRLGTVKVLQAIQQGSKVKTELGMQYGRTRYDIEEAGVQHESTIRSPSGTLAVRGTRVSFYDQPPFTPRVTSLTGRAVYTNAKRQIAFGGKGTGKASVNQGNESAADTAAAAAQIQRVIDPRSTVAMTQAEAQQLAIEVSRGAIRYDRLIVSGFQPVPSDLASAGLLPGKLNVAVSWTGFADIDLFVVLNPNTPQRAVLANASVGRVLGERVVQTEPTGGRIDFDKVSINKGAFEVAYWTLPAWKPGNIGIGAIHNDFRSKNASYSAVSDLKFEVYLSGRRLDTLVSNPDEVRAGEAPILRGTSYQTQTNLNTGRDVVSTIATLPEPTTTAKRSSAVPAAAKRPARGR